MISERNAVFTARYLLVIFDGRPSADLEDSLLWFGGMDKPVNLNQIL